MELSFFSKNILTIQDVPAQSSKYLVEIGLPNWCAPHLYFGDFEGEYLPQLKSWRWACDWPEGYDSAASKYPNVYVLGSAQGNEPIILLPNCPEVFVFDNKGCELKFLNSNVQSLGLVITEFERLVEFAVSKDQNALDQEIVPRSLVSEFLDIVGDIEQRETVWTSWAEAFGKNT
ncbi:SUKH-4 family immunity protein [Vibrio parahaemolyticus]|uniref:SUKH-4 family immunity protein n=1 Tax=Vibrio parahaemolyticus TaxID=670 RepID=UPI00111F459F|nr:SUKH-4 family immunity protein [Vibrio parahaemolyticus]EJG0707155.1 SUKH-4 family immunity protein [Vibrio parahaemolyticus]EJG1033436.1 SUKH-4 family immunity protein [Vibrio parahaemolyticus]TOK71735.1 hypothetical protein CGI13_20895 [Vibrio parahaemolyticus]